MSAIGIFVILGIAWLLSSNRRHVAWRVVAWGLGLQITFALLILKTPIGRIVFDELKKVITKILGFTDEGAHFIFGKLYETIPLANTRGALAMRNSETGDFVELGVIFAIHVIPTIIFFSSLMAVLYHLGVMQRLVKGVAWLMTRTMRTSGSESLSAAANIFVGQTEAPLVVRPYIGSMTRSEIMAIMCGGFATVAGGVLAAYVRFGVDPGHLMAASAMSAPAALMIAKILYPETEESPTRGRVTMSVEKDSANLIDAAASGAASGLKLALNVLAMILAFIALLAMINWMLGLVGGLFNTPLSIDRIFGYVFAPLAFFMGVDPQDILPFGNLLGTKIAVNEFVAYIQLADLRGVISERSYTIATYALCGFANFGSIAIQIGGISGIAPERRADLAALGLKAMFGGALASFLTATIAGLLL
ncbi:MAG: NupC/NupG family nucleoside CNT transporter [Planctomycetota bacterium]